MTWQRTVYKTAARVSWSLQHRRFPRPGLRVLMYHSVGTSLPFDTYGLSIEPGRFLDQLRALMQDPALTVVSLYDAFASPAPTRVVVTFDDGYLDTLRTAAPVLVDLGLPFTVFVTTDFIDQGHPYYMTFAELKELAALDNVVIGSHGCTHRRLTSCTDDDLRDEVKTSKSLLEQSIGKAVRAISYPHGAVDARVRTACVQAGYTVGAGSRFDINYADRDRMVLCRCEIVADDDDAVFRQKVYGAWDWYRLRHIDAARSASRR